MAEPLEVSILQALSLDWRLQPDSWRDDGLATVEEPKICTDILHAIPGCRQLRSLSISGTDQWHVGSLPQSWSTLSALSSLELQVII